ncbi:MAG: hypothetical protein HY303_18455, partial [Candidatus Wallbacteria bacterium]|nr:hypothetical protein [Candidatus Wallbacteria bacterium]
FPSFHFEVARRAKAGLAQPAGQTRRDGAGIARLVHQAYVATHERMLEDKLKYNYGFGRDALNSRSYTRDGKKLEIAQDHVADAARSIAAGNMRATAYARFFNNSGIVLGYDKTRGVQCWYLDHKGCSLGFATAIAVLGEGDEVSTHLLSRFIQRRSLEQRRRGFGLSEGLYIAMSIATEIRSSSGKMGGYFQIMFLDGARGVREMVNDSAHLASEVMRAHLWGFIGRKDAEELTTALVVDGAGDEEIEKQLFARASDPEKLRRYLMGFKPVHAPAAAAWDPVADVPQPEREEPPAADFLPEAVLQAVERAKPTSRAPKAKPRAASGNGRPSAAKKGGERR